MSCKWVTNCYVGMQTFRDLYNRRSEHRRIVDCGSPESIVMVDLRTDVTWSTYFLPDGTVRCLPPEEAVELS